LVPWQRPFTQGRPAWHWFPQKPQLFRSVFLSTQTLAQQIRVPVQVTPPQLQAPFTHPWLPAHFRPHSPQL
jgi:hypothetical protein